MCIIARYLQEFTVLGTAGGLYHFRDQIRMGNPDAFFVMNGDVCADFPLEQLYQFHKQQPEKNNTKALVNEIPDEFLTFIIIYLLFRSLSWVPKLQDYNL